MMKKIFTCMLFTLTMYVHNALAQQACDTINMPVAAAWSGISYTYSSFFYPNSGYINGTNGGGDSAKANFFDLTGKPYAYILGTLIRFGKANTANPDSLQKLIYFKVYDASGSKGGPGALLGTVQKKLADVKADVDAGRYTPVVFQPAIAIPANKKFYVAVDFTNFSWPDGSTKGQDSIWIAGTADDQVKPNAAWSFDGNKWRPYTQDFSNPSDVANDLDVTLWIFPQVATTANGCTLLPVNLLSFDAKKQNWDVQLSWQISDEMNMKGYEVEKAGNNGNFRSISVTPALNSLKNQGYTTVDRNAFVSGTTVQYRLKQIDGDGTIKYSRTITVKADNSQTDVRFANPFTGNLTMQLTTGIPQQIAMNVFDMQGRLVALQKPTRFNAGSSRIELQSTGSLKPGTYLIQISSAAGIEVYKVIKQ